MELDIGEFRDPIDGEKHDELAVGMLDLAAVDVNASDLIDLEAFPGFRRLGFGRPGDAVALEAPMQGAAAEIWDGVLEAAHHIVQRQQGPAPELHDDGLFSRGEHRAFGLFGIHRALG